MFDHTSTPFWWYFWRQIVDRATHASVLQSIFEIPTHFSVLFYFFFKPQDETPLAFVAWPQKLQFSFCNDIYFFDMVTLSASADCSLLTSKVTRHKGQLITHVAKIKIRYLDGRKIFLLGRQSKNPSVQVSFTRVAVSDSRKRHAIILQNVAFCMKENLPSKCRNYSCSHQHKIAIFTAIS